MDHLEHYLRYYETIEKPGYAVLVTGEWGVGKTTQVRRLLSLIFDEQWRDRKNPKPHVYISLFGMSSIDEIDAEVVAQLNPGASWLANAIPIGGGLAGIFRGGATTAALATKMAGPILRRELQNNDGRTIVFDDIERCKLRPSLLAGVLNRYIEHFRFRVILIAHDEKLVSSFSESREKLVGQSINAQLQTEAAWTAFVADIRSESKREFVEEHKAAILQGFGGSNVQSLRILRHVIEDVGRLFDAVDEELIADARGFEEYLVWFAQFDALVRAGTITQAHILSPAAFAYGLKDEKLKGKQPVEIQRLISNALDGAYKMNLVETKLADLMFIKGHYDEEKIKTALRQSVAFFREADQPAWQTAWHFFDVDTDVFICARDQMELQFAEHSFVIIEEILHVFGLRLTLAEQKLLGNLTLAVVEVQCLEYITFIETNNMFPEREIRDRFDIDSMTGAYGLGFSGARDEPTKTAFEGLFKALQDSYRRFRNSGVPEKAKELLSLLGNPEAFQLFFENRANRELPLFTAIDPNEFVDQLLATRVSGWRAISTTLKQRYQMAHDLLLHEREAVKALIELTDRRCEELVNSEDDNNRFKAVRLKWFFGKELRSMVMPVDV